jgi:Zn-dependent protease
MNFASANSLIVFPVVLLGWLFSLCLHEFAHALVAYHGGDTSVRDKGYLSLNPLRYIDPQLSIIYPLIFLFIGGLGLPGGAVLINRAKLKSPMWASAVSLAGPVTNAILALLLGLAFHLVPGLSTGSLGAGLAFLTLLQVSAVILNLLPVPGLDGFGIISPFLPDNVRALARDYGQGAIMVLFLAFWVVPGLSALFWNNVFHLSGALGVPTSLAIEGQQAFMFWRH